MNNKKYTYPIGKLLRFAILLEIGWWLLFGLLFFVIKWIDFKKEWAKAIIPQESQEEAKKMAQEFLLNDIKPSFLHPSYAWFFLLIPILWFIEGKFMSWKNKRLSSFSIKSIQTLLVSEVNLKQLKWRYFMMRTAIVCFVIGLMQPILGTQKTVSNVLNQEIVICLDISNSMNVKDISSVDSRLDIAKRGIVNYINTLRGERVGLCVFAGDAQVQLPLTIDYHATKMFVNEITTDIISKQGTNFSKALLTASKMFTKASNTKISMIITDGEDHVGKLSEGVKAIKDKKVKLAIFGIGSNEGGYVPNDPLHPEFGFKILPSGKRVISKLNKKLIANVANETKGSAVVINTVYPDFQSNINGLNTADDKVSKVESEIKVKQNFYPVFLGIGLILFLLYLFIPYLKIQKQIQTK